MVPFGSIKLFSGSVVCVCLGGGGLNSNRFTNKELGLGGFSLNWDGFMKDENGIRKYLFAIRPELDTYFGDRRRSELNVS